MSSARQPGDKKRKTDAFDNDAADPTHPTQQLKGAKMSDQDAPKSGHEAKIHVDLSKNVVDHGSGYGTPPASPHASDSHSQSSSMLGHSSNDIEEEHSAASNAIEEEHVDKPQTKAQKGYASFTMHTMPVYKSPKTELTLHRKDLKEVMNGESGTPIIDVIAWHLAEKYYDGSIPFARKIGGWEEWLQVELTTALMKHFTKETEGVNKYVVWREQDIYGGGSTCDLFIAPTGENADTDKTAYAIELKVAYKSVPQDKVAGSRKQGDNTRLQGRFTDDMAKLKQPFAEDVQDYIKKKKLNVQRLCIGVTNFADERIPFYPSKKWKPEYGAFDQEEVHCLCISEDKKFKLNTKEQDGMWLMWWTPSLKAGGAGTSNAPKAKL